VGRLFAPAVKAYALRLVAKGVSTRTAQAQIKKRHKVHVGEGTIRKWVKAAEAAPPAPVKGARFLAKVAAVEAEYEGEEMPSVLVSSAPPVEIVDDGDIMTTLREIISTQRAVARQATADGNTAAAARALKNASEAANTVARIEESRRGKSDDAITIPRSEFAADDAAAREYLARARADLERTGGLTCNHCGREIRIALAKGEG
jgi:hypothetical protein